MANAPHEGMIPVRLSGDRRAYIWLPRPLSQEDADEIKKWLDINVEPLPQGESK